MYLCWSLRNCQDNAKFRPQRFRRAGLSETDIIEMKETFDLLDVNGTGASSLRAVIHSLDMDSTLVGEHMPSLRTCLSACGCTEVHIRVCRAPYFGSGRYSVRGYGISPEAFASLVGAFGMNLGPLAVSHTFFGALRPIRI